MASHHVRQANTDQVLPSWLTYSPIVLPSGGTSYTILRLPLTYYGPSIPLGTDGTWTWGGLSSPAPSSTPSITATSSSLPVTTSPPVTTSLTSTLPTSTTLSSTTTTSRSPPTTTSFATPITSRRPTSTSSSPSSTATSALGAQSRLPVVAIILIALGVAAALLLCCLIAALLWRRRKARREREPPRGDSEFYAGPGPDEEGSIRSYHDVPGFTGERRSLLGNDSFVVLGARRPPMAQRSIGGVSYQRLNESQAISQHSSRRTGSDEIGVAYTEMPPPRQRRRTITAASQPQSNSSPSHPTSSSQRAFGSMLNGSQSQRSSLFEHPAEQDTSPVLPRDSAHGVVRRASDLDQGPIQPPAPTASPFAPGSSLGAELGMLGLGTRYPDVSQSLLATSSSGGSAPPRLVVPTPSTLGSRSRSAMDFSRPPSHMFAGSNTGSRASRGHSPAPSIAPPSPPARDTLSWPDSPESEHDESAQLLTAERGNMRSGVGLLGRFSWFTRGSARASTPPRTSRTSYPGWMSPPTEEGFLAEADSQYEAAGPSTNDPPTLESKPPGSHPGMVRLISSREREQAQAGPSAPRPISSVSGQSVYHDAPSQPTTPRSQVSTWLGFLGRASPASGPAPPVPTRPSPLSRGSSSTPLPGPSISRTITPPQPARTRGSSGSDVDPASRLARDEAQPPTNPSSSEGDILDAPAPESLLGVPPPTAPPSPATPVGAPVFPPGLPRLPRTWNFGLLNELGDEPPAAEERWAHLRASPDVNWRLRNLGQAVRINSPHGVTDSQVASVHGGTGSNGRSVRGSPSASSDPHQPPGAQGRVSDVSTHSRYSQVGGTMYSELQRPSDLAQPSPEAPSEASRESQRALGNTPSMSAIPSGTAPDTTTVSSNTPYPPETLVTESESGRFGFDFGLGAFGFGDDSEGYDDYETRATTVSSAASGSSSGHEAVDLHAEPRSGYEFGLDGLLRAPPMSAVGQSGWAEQIDADLGRL